MGFFKTEEEKKAIALEKANKLKIEADAAEARRIKLNERLAKEREEKRIKEAQEAKIKRNNDRMSYYTAKDLDLKYKDEILIEQNERIISLLESLVVYSSNLMGNAILEVGKNLHYKKMAPYHKKYEK